MEDDSNPGPGEQYPDAGRTSRDANDAVRRLTESVDDETWQTLRAAIGQLSGIHDPDVLAHEE